MAAPPPVCLLPVAKRPRLLCPKVPHRLSGKQPAPWIDGTEHFVDFKSKLSCGEPGLKFKSFHQATFYR